VLYSTASEMLRTLRWKPLAGDQSRGAWSAVGCVEWLAPRRGQLRAADICRVQAAATLEHGFQVIRGDTRMMAGRGIVAGRGRTRGRWRRSLRGGVITHCGTRQMPARLSLRMLVVHICTSMERVN
jgi:hypothetical protein